MRRRRLVLRVSAVCLSLALAGAYVAYRATGARRAASPGAGGQPSLAQPPRHFGGTKRAEVFEVETPRQTETFPGSKNDTFITPEDLEGKPQPAREPEFVEPPVGPR